MSRRDDSVPMRHMLDHAREAVSMVSGRSRRELDTDRMLQLALTRLVEIIGKAAKRVTPDSRARFPYIPWQDAITTRNRFATQELPPLVAALERALPGHVS